jgi:DNA-binding transcriptional LysR family regulator
VQSDSNRWPRWSVRAGSGARTLAGRALRLTAAPCGNRLQSPDPGRPSPGEAYDLPPMDKLRAIDYFLCAAREGSLTAAAHRLDVSVAAVSKLVTALERELGTRLFERSAAGLVLTADGREYLDACGPALERIRDAEAAVGRTRAQASGVVSMAVQATLVNRCLAVALPALRVRHPQIQLDLRDYLRGGDVDTESADLRLTTAWDERSDEVMRVLCRTRLVVCASAAYWAQHGIPRTPHDLESHQCLAIRAPRGTVMDQWPFEREGEKASISVSGWLTAGNAGLAAGDARVLARGGHHLLQRPVRGPPPPSGLCLHPRHSPLTGRVSSAMNARVPTSGPPRLRGRGIFTVLVDRCPAVRLHASVRRTR